MGITASLQLPYPEPDASVDVPRDIKALAQAIESRLAIVLSTTMPSASGIVSTTIIAGQAISMATTVTYPAGRFSVGPALLATTTDGEYYATSIPNGPTSGLVYSVYSLGTIGVGVTPQVQWAAIQPSPVPVGATFGGGVVLAEGRTVVQPTLPVVVTCRTPGCANANVAITVNVYDTADPGNVVCGVCSQPITDITVP
jgi:hypothetical protein